MNSRPHFGFGFFLGLFLCWTAWAAHPNNKVVITDMMDDDIKAIVDMLLDPTMEGKITAIVVSTGNVQLKTALAKKIVAGLGKHIPVYAGTSTDLSRTSATEFAAGYDKEGVPFLKPEEINMLKSHQHLDGDGAEKIHDALDAIAARAIDRVGGPLLSEQERKFLNTGSKKSGDASDRLHDIMKSSHGQGEKLDIVLLTAAPDLVAAIDKDVVTAREALGDLLTMGVFKANADGKLAPPFNALADPERHSAVRLAELFNREKVFQDFYHIPSDTIQKRSGLPNGYPDTQGKGIELRNRMAKAMAAAPVLDMVMKSTLEYAANWIAYIRSKGGWSLLDSDRWIESTLTRMRPEDAAGLYMADLGVAWLARRTKDELTALKFEDKFITAAHSTGALPIEYTSHPKAAAGIRGIKNLIELPGLQILEEHIGRLETAKNIIPTKEFFEPVPIPKGGLGEEWSLPPERDPDLAHRATLVTFKNSPDDWLNLLALVSDPNAKAALTRGGIICEGFGPSPMANAVRKVLQDLGIHDIPVVAGYKYTKADVVAPNFRGERALYGHGLGYRAFEGLKAATDPFKLDPSNLIERASEWAQKNNGKIDMLSLGEAIDFLRKVESSPHIAPKTGFVPAMGGGRPDPKNPSALKPTRNWLPHGEEVMHGLTELGKQGADVAVFSANEFGGSLVTNMDGTVGNASTFFKLLVEAEKNNAGKPANFATAILNHWRNWSRAYLPENSKINSDYNPTAGLDRMETSFLALKMAHTYLTGRLSSRYNQVEEQKVDLAKKMAGQPMGANDNSVTWLHAKGIPEIAPIAEDFSGRLSRLIHDREKQSPCPFGTLSP